MIVTVNGENREIPATLTVADLVRQLGLDKAACAVELNKRVIPKARHAEQPLADGDRIELVTLVGGG